jgi:hypothetical protein
MNMSPIISKALMESRQRDLLAQARQARLVREAERANRAAREALPAPYRVARRRRWWWRRLRLAGLFGTH